MAGAGRPTNPPVGGAYPDATMRELGSLALKLAGDPRTRRTFLKAVKELEPDRRFPDQDVQDLREEMTEREERSRVEREVAETTARLSGQRATLIASGRFTEEQVKEMEEKVMPKHGVHDYETAAILYGASFSPAKPKNAASQNNGVWELPTFEGLLDDPIKASRNMAYRAIDEINASKR